MPAPPVLINDAVRRQVLLEGVKANEAKKFLDFLKSIEKDVRARLAAEGETIRNQRRLAVLLQDLTEIQKETYTKFQTDLTDSMDGLAVEAAKLEAASLNSTVAGFEAVKPAAKQLIQAYKTSPFNLPGSKGTLIMDAFLQEFTEEQTRIITGAVSRGFATGQTVPEILKEIRGTPGANFSDGLFSTVDKNAQLTIRTAMQKVANNARQEVWAENSDLVIGVEWVSTLDSRTTAFCRALDGKVFPPDEGPRPDNSHFGCRSTTAPVLNEKYDYLDKGAKRPSKGESADGEQVVKQVSAKTTYYDWLKTQPAGFQDKVIGPVRAKLLRDGGLNADEFAKLQLNKNFQPITLEEMAEIAPEAFKAANLDRYLPKD